jgi:hypothetical protein
MTYDKSCIPIVVVDRSSQRSKLCQSSRYGMPLSASITVHIILSPRHLSSGRAGQLFGQSSSLLSLDIKNGDKTKEVGPCMV